MELYKIEQLLEKYLSAETSIQEEGTLKSYFLSGNVAPHLQEYESMFSYFAISKAETSEKSIQLNTKKTNWKWLSVAASVVLLFSVYMGNSYVQEQKTKAQYAQVKDVLKMLSTSLNKGNDAIASLYTYEDTVNKIFKTK
jgi:anti-sigma-K factor RskA